VLRDVLYNSAALINDREELAGVYRKVHLFAREKDWFRPGNDYPVFDTSLGRIGIRICDDALFPEPARILALHGADLLVIPTNWEKPCDQDWETAIGARALDNTLHVVGANRIGPDVDYDSLGKSRIIDPLGRVIAALDDEIEGHVTAEIDLDETSRLRQGYSILLSFPSGGAARGG